MKKVLIIGRPNVGKSSLFNRLIKQRRALVLDQSGVTRDILKEKASWWGHSFEVWDSGGLSWDSISDFTSIIHDKVREVLDQADLLIFVMDAQMGLHNEDKKIFKYIRDKNYLLVVNKVDSDKSSENVVSDFYTLGKDFIPAAFEKDKNVDQIVDWILSYAKTRSQDSEEKSKTSILITGQCNVGKSSLCNLILKKDRMITSPKEHTTVDVVDEEFRYNKKTYEILDTAGIRKKSRRFETLEKISSAKSLSYFKKADIILLVVEAHREISRQDIRLFSYCMEQYKTAILVINKWDLSPVSKIEMRKTVAEAFPYLSNVPTVFTSAIEGVGFNDLMKKVFALVEKSHFRTTTSKLNKFFINMTRQAPPQIYGTKNVKFYYITQTNHTPPSFIIFTNEPKGITPSYKRFLIKKIQEEYSLEGLPIGLNFLKKK